MFVYIHVDLQAYFKKHILKDIPPSVQNEENPIISGVPKSILIKNELQETCKIEINAQKVANNQLVNQLDHFRYFVYDPNKTLQVLTVNL